jgi:hypothetical protein
MPPAMAIFTESRFFPLSTSWCRISKDDHFPEDDHPKAVKMRSDSLAVNI